MHLGRVNPHFRLENQGINGLGCVHYNLCEPALVEAAIRRDEGWIGKGGSLRVTTGKYTGRSPKDKFTVQSKETINDIWWDNNNAMSPEGFEALHSDVLDHLKGRECFVQDLFAGADPIHRISVRVITEFAWHALFIRHLLRSPETSQMDVFHAEYTVLNCPNFKANPSRHDCSSETVIALDLDKKIVIISGTEYAGENKKSIFSLLNYTLPEKGVMPMHCSANHATDDPDDTAVFFGLSGTGKTTLSADTNRVLIGDDEHGWSDHGIFNLEGGCYAKTISLSAEAEPQIYATTGKFGTIIENMIFDPETRELDFDNDCLTENMRCAYPLEYIPNVSKNAVGGHPKNIIMLTCDAFGVLPPIARLTSPQAIYHFLSGFTAKIAGTEHGVTDPQPTFSACFGAPFLPRRPEVYGNLLREKIARHKTTCWLVNTGWTGGAYGTGCRMPISETRSILSAVLNGNITDSSFRKDVNFGFEVPESVPGVSDVRLNPRQTWDDKPAYDQRADKLLRMFHTNFEQFLPYVDDNVKAIALN